MEKIRLGDCATFINGYAFKPTEWSKNGIPIIRIQNLTGSMNKFNYYDGKLDSKYIINNGDILISWSASLGVFEWKKEKAYLNQHIFKVEFNKKTINKKYFVYLIKTKINEMKKNTHGSTMKHITKSDFDKIEIFLPNIQNQQEISNKLDKVQEIIDLRKKQIEELDELIKSQFVEMFGDISTNSKNYKIVKLSDISQYWNGLTYKPSDINENGTIVLRSSNIQNGKLDYKDLIRVSCVVPEKKYVKNNDILMCSRNGSARLVGKVALINNFNEDMSFGAFMMIIRSEYYPYLMTFFQMDSFRAQISTGATTTINQITSNMMNNVKLPLPSMDEINKFAKIVEQINKQQIMIEKSLEETEKLRESLMNKYFG